MAESPEHIKMAESPEQKIYLGADPDENYERKKRPGVEEFIKNSVLPKIESFETVSKKKSQFYKMLLAIIALELLMSCAPVLTQVYGGGKYTEETVSIRDKYIGHVDTRMIFTLVILFIVMINSFLFITGRPNTSKKVSFLAVVITISIMLRSGEIRLEVISMACLVTVSAFLLPDPRTLMCYMVAISYALLNKFINVLLFSKTYSLDVSILLLCMMTPFILLLLTVLCKIEKCKHHLLYVIFELALVFCLCVISVIPNII